MTYPGGTYTITLNLTGTANLGMPPVQPGQSISVSAQLFALQSTSTDTTGPQVSTPMITLDSNNPVAKFSVTTPILATTIITQIGGNNGNNSTSVTKPSALFVTRSPHH